MSPEVMSSELKKYLSALLPDYMVPSYFVLLEAIPVTSQGKIDRKSLPGPGKRSLITYAAPRNAFDEKLLTIWSLVLGVLNLKNTGMNRKIDDGTGIGIDDNFFESGGNSLKAAVLSARIQKELDVIISPADLFKMPTIREISDFIQKAAKEVFIPIEPVEKKEYYPVSPAQNRLYLLQQIDNVGTVYNIPLVLELAVELAHEKLETIFHSLIKRHESLRTSFLFIGNEVMQRIHDEVEFNIEILNNTESFIRPFDLSRAPLLRVGLMKAAEKNSRSLLMLDIHHIITDGYSQVLLAKEFMKLYAGEREILPPLRIQYKDYTLWLKSEKEINRTLEQERYWLNEFKWKRYHCGHSSSR
ncbi:MAG: condensation domain-containing protein, partial [Acidobacteria bacterium]|nr:condensation domain-containing protein [Acidobacteriota bacterium]